MRKSVRVLLIFAGIVLAVAVALAVLGPERRRLTGRVRLESGRSFIELSEGWTEFEVAGPENGEPVIFIHGLSVPMFDWDYQFDFFASSGYRVLRYNQYGRGLSDRPGGRYDTVRYVRQLNDLLDSQNWDKAHLVAHSMGCGIAVEYHRMYPERVDDIVLVAPSYHLAEDHGGIALARIPVVGDLAAKAVLADVLANRAEELFIHAGVADADRFMDLFHEQTRYFGFTRSVRSLFRNNVVDEMDNAYGMLDGRKTRLIWGTEDSSIPRRHIERIEYLAPGVHTEVLEGFGHSPNLEAPQLVNALTLAFLAR